MSRFVKINDDIPEEYWASDHKGKVFEVKDCDLFYDELAYEQYGVRGVATIPKEYCTIVNKDGSMKFTKKDLKDWMVVEFRNGKRAVVNTVSQQLLTEGSAWILSLYEEDLKRTSAYQSEVDIVKVFEANNITVACEDGILGIVDNTGKLLWQREEKSEAQLETEALASERAKLIESIRKTQEELAQRLKELEKKV